ncbi:hypothetical protein CKO09_00270 [Chromatium weissei]|nr:hypothetical protein [Chromatium weissei]
MTPDEWATAIANAPDHIDDPECCYDPNDQESVDAAFRNAVAVRGGGITAVRAALAQRRRELNSLPPKNKEALKDWLKTHSPA